MWWERVWWEESVVGREYGGKRLQESVVGRGCGVKGVWWEGGVVGRGAVGKGCCGSEGKGCGGKRVWWEGVQ